jgi:hypothetical protein
MVATGIGVNSGDYDSRTALHLAASMGNLSCVKALMGAHASMEVEDRWGNTPLHVCATDPTVAAWPHCPLVCGVACRCGVVLRCVRAFWMVLLHPFADAGVMLAPGRNPQWLSRRGGRARGARSHRAG